MWHSRNESKNHEVAGSIPSLSQWVKDHCGVGRRCGSFQVAVALVQAGSYSSNSTPSLGTSIGRGYGPKKPKKKKKKKKSLQIANAGEDVEKREHSYTTGGNVNCYKQYGKQYGGFSKN